MGVRENVQDVAVTVQGSLLRIAAFESGLRLVSERGRGCPVNV